MTKTKTVSGVVILNLHQKTGIKCVNILKTTMIQTLNTIESVCICLMIGQSRLNEDASIKFFEDNAWEPLDYWPVNDVYELIDGLTRDVMNLMGVDGTDQRDCKGDRYD